MAGLSNADADQRADVKSEVALRLIDAMMEGNTPWQRPWSADAMRPIGAASGRPYQGVNRILLAISGADLARRLGTEPDARWVTYRQAEERGWQVRRGERGTPIVKLVELGDAARNAGAQSAPSAEAAEERKRFALRRYTVFNAAQVDGMPASEAREPEFDPVVRAEAIIDALRTQTGLTVIYGGDRACYMPSTDQVLLPHKSAFKSIPGVQAAYGFYSVALHECSHSSLAEHRLARREALSKKWGDEAYAMEELTVEIAAACLAAETGVPIIHARPQAHIDHHASYLRSWISAIERDPMAIFTAAKSAEAICGYLLGLERQLEAVDRNKEWVADYDRAESLVFGR